DDKAAPTAVYNSHHPNTFSRTPSFNCDENDDDDDEEQQEGEEDDGNHFGIEQQRKMWEIKLSELTFGEKLGSGAFGSVIKGTWRGGAGCEVALKQLHKQDGVGVKMFWKEVSMMCGLRHPNIVQYYGVCMHPNHRCIVMEYLPAN